MQNVLKLLSDNIGYIVGIGSGLIVIAGWMIKIMKKPLADIKSELVIIREENKKQTKRLDDLDSDTGDILCAQLTREHEFYCEQQGWCSATDKKRIQDIYNKYRARNRNHLSEHYMKDIIDLPETKRK